MQEEEIEKTYERIADFIYETGIHSKTPRSGFWFLGSGSQSVAEHLFHTAMVAYALAHLEPAADSRKVVLMALFHDIGEGRTSDHNYVHQRYGHRAEEAAVADIAASVFFGREILELFKEEQEKQTLEARLVKDADQLEWISTLRAEEEKGNTKAKEWIDIAIKRLKTDTAKKLGLALVERRVDSWWLKPADEWFVDREEKFREWSGVEGRPVDNCKKPVVVAVSGGFDPMHIGHVRMFQEAKKMGDKLVVILNNDNWLRKKKGYVFMPQEERAEILEAVADVDEVVFTEHQENPADMSVCAELRKIRPDIFVNGGDRHADNVPEVAICDEIGCKMVYNVGAGGKVQSSSWLINNMKK